MKIHLISMLVLGLVCSASISAQTSAKLLPFQGRLTDQNGVAVSNGVRLVQFKIFEVPTGGSPVWAGELHRTTVNGGLVNVLLGSKTPFTGVDFDRQVYLDITVDINGDNQISPADPPMLPRQAILPVVFAKETANSRKLNGYDWNQILGVSSPSEGIPGSRIANGTIDDSKLVPAGVFFSRPAMDEGIGTSPVGGVPSISRAMEYNQWVGVSTNLEVVVTSTGRPMWIGLIGGNPNIHTNMPESAASMYMYFGPASNPSSVRLKLVNETNGETVATTIYSQPAGYLDFQRCSSLAILPAGTHRLKLYYNALRGGGDPDRGKDFLLFNYIAIGAYRL